LCAENADTKLKIHYRYNNQIKHVLYIKDKFN